MASGSDDQTIKIWDSSTWSLKRTLTGHKEQVNSLAVLKNGDLASGSWDKTIKIWDSSTGSLKRTLTGHSNYVLSLALLQNGDLASGSTDKTINIWDSSTGSLKRTLKGHSDWVLSLAVLQNGDLSSGSWGEIKIWDSSLILDSKKNIFKETMFTVIDGEISRTVGYSPIFNWFEIDLNILKEKIKESFNVICIVCGKFLFD